MQNSHLFGINVANNLQLPALSELGIEGMIETLKVVQFYRILR